MYTLKINNAVILYPSQWNELNRHQLEALAGLSAMQLTESSYRFHLFCALTGLLAVNVSPVVNKNQKEPLYCFQTHSKERVWISANQLASLMKSLDFLFAEPEDGQLRHLESRLTVNLIPWITLRGERYYGPSDRLFNLNFAEFIHAEEHFTRYLKNRDAKHLDYLAAILYRPQGKDYDPLSVDYRGDRREPFNDHLIGERVKSLEKINLNVKLCIFLFYSGCKRWIQHQFPHVFSGHGSTPAVHGLLGLVDTLTGGDVTKVDAIRSSLLMDVLIHLEKAAVEYEQQKKSA